MSTKKERKEEFERHKTTIEDDYQSGLTALYRLYPEFKPWQENGKSGGRGKLPDLVKEALKRHNENFTLKEMGSWLVEIDPIFSKTATAVKISNTLGRFVRKGILERIPNSSPLQYKKKADHNVK